MHGARDIDHKDEFSGWNILLPDPFRRLHHQQEKLFVFVLKKHKSRFPLNVSASFKATVATESPCRKTSVSWEGVTTSCRAIPVEIFAVILNFVSGLLPCGRYGLL